MTLDEHFGAWFNGCYAATKKDMPLEQQRQLEAAFYSGAASSLATARDDDGETFAVAAAVLRHLERCRAGTVLPL